jgi:hypothetical protein
MLSRSRAQVERIVAFRERVEAAVAAVLAEPTPAHQD